MNEKEAMQNHNKYQKKLKTINDLKNCDEETVNKIKKIALDYIKEFQRQRKEETDWGMVDLKIGDRVTSIGCRSEACGGIEDFINHLFNIEQKE